jgi:hydroxymethylglutaryl-CoA lyase
MVYLPDMEKKITLIECPRDAMQGLHDFIPTQQKANYINSLLKVGYDVIDFGSFVSPSAIPQMKDTRELLKLLDLSETKSRLLAIIANKRGADEAVLYPEISYLGYPFSISETFQRRNTNRGITEAFEDVKHINELAKKNNKQLVIYISMGFGNPYGDLWNPEIVESWLTKLMEEEIHIFSLADTIGAAGPEEIISVFSSALKKFPEVKIGAHFHSTPGKQIEKITAAYESGCRRFDSAMLGFGGCPMAADELTGNISTENLISYLRSKGEILKIDDSAFIAAQQSANILFNKYH